MYSDHSESRPALTTHSRRHIGCPQHGCPVLRFLSIRLSFGHSRATANRHDTSPQPCRSVQDIRTRFGMIRPRNSCQFGMMNGPAEWSSTPGHGRCIREGWYRGQGRSLLTWSVRIAIHAMTFLLFFSCVMSHLSNQAGPVPTTRSRQSMVGLLSPFI